MSTPDPTDSSHDVDTAELPTLNIEALDPNFDLDFPENTPELTDEPGDRATAWMSDMATEVENLRDRWKQVDGELNLSRERVAELEDSILRNDDQNKQLAADLEAAHDEKAELESRIAEAGTRIDELNAQIKEQATSNNAAVKAHADLTEAFDKLKKKLDKKDLEIDRQTQSARSYSERITELETTIHDSEKTAIELQGRIQELEGYVEGRRSRWMEQDSKLAEYEERLQEMSIVVDGKVEQLAAKDKERDSLKSTIVDLEKRLSQFVRRSKEQDFAFDKFQKSLQDQISITEQLKADLSLREKESDDARGQITAHLEQIRSHEEDLQLRDSILEQLEATASDHVRHVDELTTKNTRLAEELAQSKETRAERDATIEDLQSELDKARVAISTAEAEVAEFDATRSQLLLENAKNLDAAEELRSQLSTVEKARDDLSERLASAEETIASLGDKLKLTEDSVSDFEAETASMHDQINRLQVDIKHKQAMIDAFDRGAERLNELNRDMRRGTSDGDQPVIIEASHLFDESISTQDRSGPTNDDCVATGDDVQRMLVVAFGGKSVVHKLTKDRMTLGRSDDCDINIRDPIVSRVHAHFIKHERGTEVEDALSTNGILVNKESVERAVLRHGDIVSLAGRLHIRYMEAEPGAENP